MQLKPIQTRMAHKLEAAFSPTHLSLFDESHKHAGHAGAPPGSNETHIGMVIVSNAFSGLSRIERSRAVHRVLAEEIAHIHAITLLKTLTPQEFAASPTNAS